MSTYNIVSGEEVVNYIINNIDSTQTIIESIGIQGVPGPPGQSINEDDLVYSKRLDVVTDYIMYRGEAVVGSSESSALWRIRKITIGLDGDISETWASGTASFDKIWADRALYTYS
jgi:hypothetical protein